MEAFPEPITFGPYRLHAKIAQGGMAEVLLGTTDRKEYQGQFLAIKKLLPHLNSNKPFVNLLIHEAKIGVLLNHPGIVSVFDLGSFRTEFFLAMEYVHGKSLDKILERVKKGEIPKPSIELSTFIILELVRALTFAHQLQDNQERELNIIHRDVSPGNILLGYRGEVKLTDFGIATAEHRLQPGFTNAPLGKLSYMAPEQAVNDPVVRASDVYSLGVVYYELLTGQLPFQAENATALYKRVVDGKMADLKLTGPTLAPELRNIVTKCLNRSARKRYQSAPEFYQALHDFFKKSSDLDFSSKTVRQYYKKKLSEYLRNAFGNEVVEEIEVIQSALNYVSQIESFKRTSPQDVRAAGIGADLPSAEEATVFQQDLTEEATRHYPLSPAERKKIIQGLSPREVLSKKSRLEPASPFSKQTEPGSYFPTTKELPEIEAQPEEASGKAFQIISVEDKLRLSLLDKENKESLKSNQPKWEIHSKLELETFEKKTFADNHLANPAEEEATRTMSREEILTDFNAFRKGQANSPPDKKYFPKKTDFSEASDAEPTVRDPRSLKRPSHRSFKKATKRILAVAAGIFFIAGLSWFTVTQWQPLTQLISAQRTFLPTQKVLLIFEGEASPTSQLKFFNSLHESGPFPSIRQIENFFNEEYTRYTGDSSPVLKLETRDPKSVAQALSSQTQLNELFKTEKVFSFLENVTLAKERKGFDSIVYIYLFAYSRALEGNGVFPEEFKNSTQRREAAVFAPSHPSRRLKLIENVARGIAFLYGATNKNDLKTAMPQIPSGLADPFKNPQLPQLKAELMGKNIALSPTQSRSILSLNEVVIGAQTAFEMNWIDEKKRNELLKIKPSATP